MTEKYVRRNIVDAIQFDQKAYGSWDDVSYRTHKSQIHDFAWCQELDEPYVIEHRNQPRSILGVTAYVNGRYVPVDDGDWIVRTGPRTVEVMTDDEFNYFYKKAD